MTTLNRAAACAALAAGVRACTDVTGFGLVGHAQEMALAGAVGLRISLGTLPLLPGARAYVEGGHTPGGLDRNRAFYGPQIAAPPDLDPTLLDLVFDPETSGGLLLALPPERADAFAAALPDQPWWVIGEVTAGASVTLAP